LSPQTEFVTHGQCDARPTVTFPAAERHRPLTGSKLYCLVNRGTCVNNLPGVVTWSGVEPATSGYEFGTLLLHCQATQCPLYSSGTMGSRSPQSL